MKAIAKRPIEIRPAKAKRSVGLRPAKAKIQPLLFGANCLIALEVLCVLVLVTQWAVR